MAGVVRKRVAKGVTTYVPNKRFEHYESLQAFLRTTTNLDDTSIIAKLKKGGALRLIVLSGLFTGAVETKADILVVVIALKISVLRKQCTN